MASGSGWNLWVWLAGGGCGWNLWLHIMFYTRRSTHKQTLHILQWTLAVYAFNGRGVDLEVEGVRYIEMHCRLHTC